MTRVCTTLRHRQPSQEIIKGSARCVCRYIEREREKRSEMSHSPTHRFVERLSLLHLPHWMHQLFPSGSAAPSTPQER